MAVDFKKLAKTCDFSGWATKNDILCSDGRTIKKNAFIGQHGARVPIVWNHRHDSIENVLGHAYLENREDGVYAYCFANSTDGGQRAKELTKNKDISAFSIWANGLKQKGGDVLHGVIRELSLVLAGANPGAVIDSPLAHDGLSNDQTEALIRFVDYSDIPTFNDVIHSNAEEDPEVDSEIVEEETDSEESNASPDSSDEVIEHSENDLNYKELWNSLTEDQKSLVDYIVYYVQNQKDDLNHSDEDADDSDSSDEVIEHSESTEGKTFKEVFETMNNDQKDLVYYLYARSINSNKENGDGNMKHSVFEASAIDTQDTEPVLAHSEEEIRNVFEKAASSRVNSVKEHFLSHGITEIEKLFPDYKSLTNAPEFINRPDAWVKKVMNGVKHTPFSRIKTMFADITKDEARAKGYIKGTKKTDEQFGLLKRYVEPTTIYKKQTLDRDDILDITDFDVVAWLKMEMRGMLEEEIARQILVGDGRAVGNPDRIDPTKIIPIWTDAEMFAIHTTIEIGDNDTTNTRADKFIDAAVRAHDDYRGSGSPTMYVDQSVLTDMLLQKDLNGRRIYTSKAELATALLVDDIIPIPVMKGLRRSVTVGEGNEAVTTVHTLMAIVVNLDDYRVGADKGGDVAMFDDFDIDYNQQKYLIETRMSGMLVKPSSAIVIESIPASE